MTIFHEVLSTAIYSDDSETMTETICNALLYEANLDNAIIENCRIPNIFFQGLNANNLTFKNCDLSGADFSLAELAFCKFQDCKLEGVKFDHAMLFCGIIDDCTGNYSLNGADTTGIEIINAQAALAA